MTLKDWFILQAVDFVDKNSNQLALGFDDTGDQERQG
jgi:hypothetical protein